MLFQVFKALKPSKAPSFVKRGQWVRFHQAGSSQNEQSLVLLTKGAKNGRWVSYSFLQIRTGASPGTFSTVSGTARMVPAEDPQMYIGSKEIYMI